MKLFEFILHVLNIISTDNVETTNSVKDQNLKSRLKRGSSENLYDLFKEIIVDGEAIDNARRSRIEIIKNNKMLMKITPTTFLLDQFELVNIIQNELKSIAEQRKQKDSELRKKLIEQYDEIQIMLLELSCFFKDQDDLIDINPYLMEISKGIGICNVYICNYELGRKALEVAMNFAFTYSPVAEQAGILAQIAGSYRVQRNYKDALSYYKIADNLIPGKFAKKIAHCKSKLKPKKKTKKLKKGVKEESDKVKKKTKKLKKTKPAKRKSMFKK